MKTAVPVLLLLQLCLTPTAHAAYYQWLDEAGVTHFTDDHDKIPAKYRKKAHQLKLQEEPSRAEGEGEAAPATPPGEPQGPTFGGHGEQWWRGRFAALRNELKAIEERRPEKQAKLSELRRMRVIYERGKDREALNLLETEISADESRADELRKQIGALDQEASRSGVPFEWRR